MSSFRLLEHAREVASATREDLEEALKQATDGAEPRTANLLTRILSYSPCGSFIRDGKTSSCKTCGFGKFEHDS